MASTTTTMSSTTAAPTTKGSSKGSKTKSLILKLRLSPGALSKFAADLPATDPSQAKSTSSSTTSNSHTTNPAAEPSPSANASDSNGTPNPSAATNNNLLAPPPNAVKRKGIPGPKPGMKRNASQMSIDGIPKPRGKPGPKKKPRPYGTLLDDPSSNPASTSPPRKRTATPKTWTNKHHRGDVVNGITVLPATAPKLGPKANQGAINAHLRALDRTGKPCRKWQRAGFQLRSFTGVNWGVSSWATMKKQPTDFAGDVKSDSSGSTDLKGIQESSAAPSDKSNSGPDAATPLPAAEATGSPPLGLADAAAVSENV